MKLPFKNLRSVPVKWYQAGFFMAVSFTLFMALIPGKVDPTAGLIHSKLKHAISFFVLACMMDRFVFPTNAFRLWKPASLLGFGVLIEVLQWFTEYRTFSILDVAADCVGILAYYLVSALFFGLSFSVTPSSKERKSDFQDVAT